MIIPEGRCAARQFHRPSPDHLEAAVAAQTDRLAELSIVSEGGQVEGGAAGEAGHKGGEKEFKQRAKELRRLKHI